MFSELWLSSGPLWFREFSSSWSYGSYYVVYVTRVASGECVLVSVTY